MNVATEFYALSDSLNFLKSDGQLTSAMSEAKPHGTAREAMLFAVANGWRAQAKDDQGNHHRWLGPKRGLE